MEVYLGSNFPNSLFSGILSPDQPPLLKYILMKIFLAGGYSGNLRPLWDQCAEYIKDMQLYLACNYGSCNEGVLRPYFNKAVEQYLSKSEDKTYKEGNVLHEKLDWDDLNLLESFFYLRGNTTYHELLPYYKNFLLDSGAFTFMQGVKGKVDWDGYLEEYAAYINKHNIMRFFELDIDSLVGIKEVERLRSKLEKLTNKQPIPVWHISRGKDYFFKICDAYKYVAIGGIVTKEIPTKKYEPLFPWFIQQAHQRGCKIHGLGYTNIKGLHKYHFDSVDSTTWLYGNRGGYVYLFNPLTGMMDRIQSETGARLSARDAAIHNFNEWVKFQKYARIRL